MKVVWKDVVIAESDSTVVVEGNHYFPLSSVNQEYLKKSTLNTNCPWKGKAHYYHVTDVSNILEDAAWYYPDAKEKAKNIEGYIAFWKGVSVS